MKKLEDIPKKNIFEVPDGYFEKLPAIIQSRIAGNETRSIPSFGFTLRFGVPMLMAIAVAAIFWLNRLSQDVSAESILASVETEALVAYLKESDITTDELLDIVELDAEDAGQIEESVYEFQVDESDLKDILNEIDQ